MCTGVHGGEDFMAHAGDDLVMSDNCDYVVRLAPVFQRYQADAALYVTRRALIVGINGLGL